MAKIEGSGIALACIAMINKQLHTLQRKRNMIVNHCMRAKEKKKKQQINEIVNKVFLTNKSKQVNYMNVGCFQQKELKRNSASLK